jgi:hypothetical protein
MLRTHRRKYTRRFYRKVLKKRYDRDVQLGTGTFSNWISSVTWNNKQHAPVNFKAFFHLKIFFNINEFLLYDFYNYHKNFLKGSFIDKNSPQKFIAKKPWKKLNFFYYIRYSIDVLRTHTLQFFKIKFKTDRKVTVFFNSFNSLGVMSYIWFFEYSLPYFLVKTRYAESISQGLILTMSDVVFINGLTGFTRWSVVTPGDCLQLPFSLYLVARLRWMILKFFDFFRRTYRFFRRTVLRAKKFRTKMPNMTAKGIYLNDSKHLHFRLLESDYKSMTVILVPYSNPTVYYSALTLFWLNFWNYRLNVWKYEI